MGVVWFSLMMFFHIFFLFRLLGLTAAGQESVELLTLHDTSQQPPQTDHPIAVPVSDKALTEISTSVQKAETWLRSHVLSHYPRTKITTIVVSASGFCQNDEEHKNSLVLVLPSLKNIYHSITRWGLDKEIKVSPSFPYHCLNPQKYVLFKDEFFEKLLKPIFIFLQSTNSTFTIDATPKFSPLSDNDVDLMSFNMHSMEKLGSLSFNKVNVITSNIKKTKPIVNGRKLSSFMEESRVIDPYPARPTPLPEISPIHSSIGFSAPATIAKNPKNPNSPLPTHFIPPPPTSLPFASAPPLSSPVAPKLPPVYYPPPPTSSAFASPPPVSTPIAPELPPAYYPPPSPFGYTLPPCAPPYSAAPQAPFAAAPAVEALWCVAKPSVPAETLQQALDFACGEGGADCDEIMPHGNCFYPDTVVAHASYAFNSYWQKTKRGGGSCSFGGTAMLISADPSFLHCRFLLA